jgi:DNA invertase Pin-like site-specific DNA recombinase
MLKSTERVVVYRRVSTESQRHSGLGLAAQENLIAGYLAMTGAERLSTYEESKSGKIRTSERPELAKAIAEAKAMKATLLFSALSRTGRNRADVLTLIDESGVKVAFADEPHASSLSIGIKAVIADDEGKAISNRTKAALAVAKVRLEREGKRLGNPLGAKTFEKYREADKAAGGAGNSAATAGAKAKADEFANNLKSYIVAMVAEGKTNAQIAIALNAKGVPTRRDGAKWYETSVKNLVERLKIKRPAKAA